MNGTEVLDCTMYRYKVCTGHHDFIQYIMNHISYSYMFLLWIYNHSNICICNNFSSRVSIKGGTGSILVLVANAGKLNCNLVMK